MASKKHKKKSKPQEPRHYQPRLSEEVKRLTLTVHEAAQELRCSDRKIWGLVSSGELPSVKVGGSRLIVRDKLEAYLAGLGDGGF